MQTNRTYLIVDDDEDDIEFFIEVMEEMYPDVGCDVANDGEEALDRLRKSTGPVPELIFLDLNMPRMDGKSCLKELSKHPRLKEIPVIIYTTSSALKDKEETSQLGAAYFLTKPTTLDGLREGLAKAIASGCPKLIHGN